jgi:hypothetical protein
MAALETEGWAMTEAEWLACAEPSRLLASLFSRTRRDKAAGDERFRRFAIACCRRVAEVLAFGDTYALDCLEIYATSRLREALLKARRFHRPAANDASRALSAVSGADGVTRLRAQARSLATSAVWTCTKSKSTQAAMAYREAAAAMATIKVLGAPIPDSHPYNQWLAPDPAELAMQACFLRDIFGNPFRPVTIAEDWLTPTVLALAQGNSEDSAFDRLPILADALEDAGCNNAEVLHHCRGPGPHVKGCWVIDALLSKK